MTDPSAPARPQPTRRSAYRVLRPITTRWMDNDIYGHLNNVVHYSLFDTAVNGHLVEQGALDLQRGSVIGLVVETRCHYFEPLSFPQTVWAGLKLLHRGNSSVQIEVALFGGESERAAALGRFVHVYVDREHRRPVAEMPPHLTDALDLLKAPA